MSFKKIQFIILAALLFTLPTAYATMHTHNNTAMQNEILHYINEYRQHHGLSRLTMNDDMVREARQHSMDMATHKMSFGHQYFEQRIARLHTHVKNSGAGSENVAYNYKDARTVVQQWLLSPGHKRNIVGNYNMTGIGVAQDQQGRFYYTQIFLRTGEESRHHAHARASFNLPFVHRHS